jgi:hypothetical protein
MLAGGSMVEQIGQGVIDNRTIRAARVAWRPQ